VENHDVTTEDFRESAAQSRHGLQQLLSVELPEGLDAEALDASLSNGVLRVRISKAEAGPRRVPIACID
jgi:HSP20 family molecular chaperone IbpA